MSREIFTDEELLEFFKNFQDIINSQKELNVRFQNPTTGYLSIELSQAEILNTISIQDLSGKTVAKKAINNSTTVDFDLNHLSRGVYFINLQSKSGNQQVKKLIKI